MAFEVTSAVSTDRPRLFITNEDLPEVRGVATGRESTLFDRIEGDLARLADQSLDPNDYGKQASLAALAYLVTGEDRYVDQGQRLLELSLTHYENCYERGESVTWRSYSRVCALSAWDWLYREFDSSIRHALAERLFTAVERVQPTDEREPFPRENWGSDYQVGFYGTTNLQWYAGLGMIGEGIDDELAETYVENGWEDHHRMLSYRADRDGIGTYALNYALGSYPWSTFNFFCTCESALGQSIHDEWLHPTQIPNHLYWNLLPGNKEFGFGDTPHGTNDLRTGQMNAHCSWIERRYADVAPRRAAFAAWVKRQIPREHHYERLDVPFVRLLLPESSVEPHGPPPDIPHAQRFGSLGQHFFRSGSGVSDTYAAFTAGGNSIKHRHFDENNFVIYRSGFLALDSGTRPEPSRHLANYYADTVAHNCVTIRKPDEDVPGHWGTPEGEDDVAVPNTGGQRDRDGGTVVAYESTADFGYVAGDATGTYHDDKCDLALRQFVFCPPNHFVVFDRVRTTEPGYPTRWLLHAPSEPALADDGFAIGGRGPVGVRNVNGVLNGRTLLPKPADLDAVGGENRQFLADKVQWSIPDHHDMPESLPLLGQYRIEVEPGTLTTATNFLHLLEADRQTGLDHGEFDRLDPTALQSADLVREDGTRGVRFSAADKTWTVTFATEGSATGHIERRTDETVELDRPLAATVPEEADPAAWLTRDDG